MAAALSWEEIVERGKQHNKTVICEVEKKGFARYFKIKCNFCENVFKNKFSRFDACTNCARNCNGYNKEEFVIKAQKVHGNKFEYNAVEYINNGTKVKILCNTCNNIFQQIPRNHLRGDGCLICARKKFSIDRRKSILDFVNKSKELNGEKYDYSLVEYINSHTEVKILCNKCDNIFKQMPASHLRGSGCNICAGNQKSNKEEFVLKAQKIHCDKYNYDLVEYVNTVTKVKIKCNKCNTIFNQRPANHLRFNGCPKCNESKGENKVAKYLSEKNIKYTRNKIFKTLKNKSYLKPDFYLDILNLLIEYDGEYHYLAKRGSTPEIKQKNLEICQHRDKIKNEWAKANNIPLLRIPYWDFDRIEELIDAFIIKHTKKEIKQLVMDI
jgi:hypothetical protein